MHEKNSGNEYVVSVRWCYTSVALAVLYSAAAVTYWTAFGQRYASVKSLNDFIETKDQSLQWFQDNPDHEGVKMICTPGIQDLSWTQHCYRFKRTKNVLAYKVLELTFASLAEAIILLSDGVLVSVPFSARILL
jgi:hypothetical protein